MKLHKLEVWFYDGSYEVREGAEKVLAKFRTEAEADAWADSVQALRRLEPRPPEAREPQKRKTHTAA